MASQPQQLLAPREDNENEKRDSCKSTVRD